MTVPKLFQPCPVPSLLLPLSIPFPLHPSPNLALSLNTFRRAPKKQSELAINRNLIKLDNADYKMLQELFSFFVPQQQQPRPPPPTHHVHEGRRPRREAFMKSSTTLFVFNGKIFVQRGTRGRLTATRLPGTHPSTPPPLDSDSVALAVLLFTRG